MEEAYSSRKIMIIHGQKTKSIYRLCWINWSREFEVFHGIWQSTKMKNVWMWQQNSINFWGNPASSVRVENQSSMEMHWYSEQTKFIYDNCPINIWLVKIRWKSYRLLAGTDALKCRFLAVRLLGICLWIFYDGLQFQTLKHV